MVIQVFGYNRVNGGWCDSGRGDWCVVKGSVEEKKFTCEPYDTVASYNTDLVSSFLLANTVCWRARQDSNPRPPGS